ncbi:hypothetical protein CYMTET_45493 [Cymbomonas tetramitiformis]|uniref:DUF218 domain-containing protein n=1 Tax=Cymbomonas tetramitiformis TaxID=36881 RepID=A0AAE0BY51_9CHLO|nr:hypothetical protein CYMTET_45493 [Cymbomonas tetramitiformis]
MFQHPPEAVLVLGGDGEREQLAAALAAGSYPGQLPSVVYSTSLAQDSRSSIRSTLCAALPIYVSSGHDNVGEVLSNAGVPSERVHVDVRAVDTVTNFTTLVSDFQRREVRHVLMVTSEYHVQRAIVVGSLILGSRGIAMSAISLPSTRYANGERRESLFRVARDAARALLWIFTGFHGGSLGRMWHPERFHPKEKP